jgi:hypothetical protein
MTRLLAKLFRREDPRVTAAKAELARLVAEARRSAEIESYRAHRRAALKSRANRTVQGAGL